LKKFSDQFIIEGSSSWLSCWDKPLPDNKEISRVVGRPWCLDHEKWRIIEFPNERKIGLQSAHGTFLSCRPIEKDRVIARPWCMEQEKWEIIKL